MTIGTAKPTAEELQAVKHYFIDEFPVTTQLTAADYESLALKYLSEIFAGHDAAVVCGGTGLYIKALCEGLDDMPETNKEITAKIEQDYQLHGLQWLQQAVQEGDPAFYATGEIQNPVRLIRALSFVRSAGSSITQYRTQTKKQRPFNIVKVGLELPRAQLYDRINKRVDIMMAEGLLDEVKQLLPYKALKNLQTVGYTELFDHLEGKCTLPEAVDKIKQHTRNYAKRQMTWFKKDTGINWMAADDANITEKITGLPGR
ncbi:MAG: tRNA delta(2)-isopentenylpyrophosphate transferase [Flavipsychrobacter sp.]|nr:tRNA delta(2)-isopentenylpyrophosphate transferase [Flavipsychrobacter sp.]